MTAHAYGIDPAEYVVRRLNTTYTISQDAQAALRRAITIRPMVPAHEEVDVASCAAFLLQGLASRVRLMADGRRQLTGFLVSGDVCDYGFLSGCTSSTRIFTLTNSIIAEVRMPAFIDLCDEHPDVLRALLRSTAIESAVAEERIVSLGLRTALERLGHLFCEIFQRLDDIGLVKDQAFDFQVTQAELGEGLGISAVHVNRTLQRLRKENFVTSRGGRVQILDGARLRDMAGYDLVYVR